jgi:hypothetical protein
MPSVGLFERAKTVYALDGAATVMDTKYYHGYQFNKEDEAVHVGEQKMHTEV